MNYEMRVEEHSNPLVVFMHQMIPHHENAVNMAKWAHFAFNLDPFSYRFNKEKIILGSEMIIADI